MAKVFIEEQTLTDIADAVRAKNGTSEPIKTVELATAITNIPTGRNPLELLYTEGAEITPEDWGNANIKLVSNNNYFIIDGTKCKKIAFPDTQTVGICLSNNPYLEEFDSGRNATRIKTSIHGEESCFYNCYNLKKMIMGENFLPFSNYGFSFCNSLKEVRYYGTLDKWAEAIRNYNYNRSAPFGYSGGGSFYLGDSAEPLTEINLTTATSVHGGAFYNFKDVIKAHLGTSVASIGDMSFYGCGALETLILEGDTFKTLSNIGAFNNTPIASGTGVIYIKPITADEATLVAEYQAATNWSTFANIKPFSEYAGGAE